MNAESRTEQRRPRMLLGAFACLCLLLHPLQFPLHLALHDHDLVHTHTAHVHGGEEPGHVSCAHRHVTPSAQPPGDHDHDPHPVLDHEEDLADQAVLLPRVHKTLALPLAAATPLVFDRPSPQRVWSTVRVARPPPPRARALSRAPPVVS